MKVVEIISPVTINGVKYDSGKELKVCDELCTDLVDEQKCAILIEKKSKKKGK